MWSSIQSPRSTIKSFICSTAASKLSGLRLLRDQGQVLGEGVAPYLKVPVDGRAQIGHGLIDIVEKVLVAEDAFPQHGSTGL